MVTCGKAKPGGYVCEGGDYKPVPYKPEELAAYEAGNSDNFIECGCGSDTQMKMCSDCARINGFIW